MKRDCTMLFTSWLKIKALFWMFFSQRLHLKLWRDSLNHCVDIVYVEPLLALRLIYILYWAWRPVTTCIYLAWRTAWTAAWRTEWRPSQNCVNIKRWNKRTTWRTVWRTTWRTHTFAQSVSTRAWRLPFWELWPDIYILTKICCWCCMKFAAQKKNSVHCTKPNFALILCMEFEW